MAVTARKEENKTILEITNGDLLQMEEILHLWDFKTEQSLFRFLLSILIETQDKEIWIKCNEERIAIGPVPNSLTAHGKI